VAQQEEMPPEEDSSFLAAGVQTAYQHEFDRQPFTSQQLTWLPDVEASASAEIAIGGEEEWEVVEQALPFQPQTLSHWRSRATGTTYIQWTVDGNKLRSNDRLTVSPLFKLSDGHVNAPPLPFKMMISPKIASNGKGGASFRKAEGRSVIQLKCEAPRDEAESCPISFYLSAGSGRQENECRHAPRGPVTCNFAQSGLCGLPKECEVWDLLDIEDKQSHTFVVCLEVLSSQR